MSFVCLIFAAILSATACPPRPPPLIEALGEARTLRPDAERAIEVANDVLRVAREPFRIVASWQLNGRGLREDELVVYLVGSPLSPRELWEERSKLETLITSITSDLGEINPDASNCGDKDDCVGTLYPETSIKVVMDVLNRQNTWELAKTSPECRCIVLMEQHLLLFRIVFGADWARYILLMRYDSKDQLQADLDSGRVPDVLLESKRVPLEAMVAFLLLHEVGHVTKVPLRIPMRDNADLAAFLDRLSSEQREELRADSFIVRLLAARCFRQNPTGLLLDTCYTPAVLSMLTFVVGMKGKSKDALCLRYLDTVAGYPNWQGRLLLLGYQYEEVVGKGYSLLTDYLSTRRHLLEKASTSESKVCRDAALRFSANRSSPASGSKVIDGPR
ncbi:hypothetical protein [Reyranella sp.]|uniref:hypothetical protein n=1 Tax=Reyranella sp. TaxID=1929291 RepID=UPI003D0CE29A